MWHWATSASKLMCHIMMNTQMLWQLCFWLVLEYVETQTFCALRKVGDYGKFVHALLSIQTFNLQTSFSRW
jgi:hypothetical protein